MRLKGIYLKDIRSVPEKSELIETPICNNIVFQACILFLRCFRTSGAPRRTIIVHSGMLPSCPLNGLTVCKSVSRSDLVSISFWTLREFKEMLAISYRV